MSSEGRRVFEGQCYLLRRIKEKYHNVYCAEKSAKYLHADSLEGTSDTRLKYRVAG